MSFFPNYPGQLCSFLNSATVVTALIFNEKGELLLTRRGVEPAYGKLDLPGGFVDPNESEEHALLREIKEELNLEPEKISYWGSFPNEYIFSGTTVFTVDLVFKCQIKILVRLLIAMILGDLNLSGLQQLT